MCNFTERGEEPAARFNFREEVVGFEGRVLAAARGDGVPKPSAEQERGGSRRGRAGAWSSGWTPARQGWLGLRFSFLMKPFQLLWLS